MKPCRDPGSDEATRPRHEPENTGPGLLEAALARENLQQALKRVRANKGAAGIDGLDIDQTADTAAQRMARNPRTTVVGDVPAQPVRRVTIPKPDGGERELGIPTVTDRLIQQALLQVLQPILDPTFSEHSYGFRPGRSAHDAVLAAQAYVQSGRRVVVDVDLEKFFDRVNHDILMDRVQKRIGDAGVIRLIRAYLNSGIMMDGVVQERRWERRKAVHCRRCWPTCCSMRWTRNWNGGVTRFVRYADDANVYVRSRRAGERVMALLLTALWPAASHGQRDQERGGQRVPAQVPGLQLLGGSRRQDQTPGGRQTYGNVQATRPATHPSLGRTQSRRGGEKAANLCVGMEGLLPAGANAASLAGTGQVDATPAAGDPTQALEARQDHLPRTAGTGSFARGRGTQVAANSRRWWRNSGMLLNGVLNTAWADRLGIPRLS